MSPCSLDPSIGVAVIAVFVLLFLFGKIMGTDWFRRLINR